MLAFVDEGDEVIALEPFYDSYRATIAMARGRCVPFGSAPPEFRLDEALLRAAVTARTRVILLNSPHNPTGAVLTRDELELVATRCDRTRPDRRDRRGLRTPVLR